MLHNEIESANNSLNFIKNIDYKLLPNHVLAEYYIIRAWNEIARSQPLLAKNSLLSARKHLNNSEYLSLVAEYQFQSAQLAALEEDWLKCIEHSLIATQMATSFYPTSWDLPATYQALQDKCSINNNK
jgi:hypothetical protein